MSGRRLLLKLRRVCDQTEKQTTIKKDTKTGTGGGVWVWGVSLLCFQDLHCSRSRDAPQMLLSAFTARPPKGTHSTGSSA